MFDVAFSLKNETGSDIKVVTSIPDAVEPSVAVVKNGEEIVHFRPENGHVSIILKEDK